MDKGSVPPRLRWVIVVWLLLLFSATAAKAEELVVQQIGDVGGRIAEAVAAEVSIVPFSPSLDARTTPIVLATGKAFVRPGRGGTEHLAGLRPAERTAIRRAYEAGQVILLLDASTHDIEALHLLLDDGVAYESTTDPVVLAYALRQENGVPRARLVTHPPADDELASSLALEIVLAELTRPAAVPEQPAAAVGSANLDWKSTPVQSTVLTSTTNGVYNTPIAVYALHACQENMDYYLVNTGGDWTATQAGFESADTLNHELSWNRSNGMAVDWQASDAYCQGGFAVSSPFGDDQRICRYVKYPLSYEVAITPPSGPTVVQINAVPAGDQGLSTSYEFGFSFSIDGEVNVEGGSLGPGVSWDNTVSTTVPPLVVDAGDIGEGTFTKYNYCTVGDTVENCMSNIQMTGASGTCREFIVGQPQNGQTPNGRLSDVAQTVYWQVDPSTYTDATFNITVTWTVQLATSTSFLWTGALSQQGGPNGYCNIFGCSCGISLESTPISLSYEFKVKPPSKQCSARSANGG